MNLQQKAVKGLVWSFVQSYGSQVITLLVFLLLARLLKPEVFGLIALANIFTNFIQIFLDQGLGEAIVQRKELEPEHLDTAFWVNIASGAVLMAIGLLGADLVAQFFHEPRLSPIIRWLSLTLLIGAFNVVQRALLRRNLSFRILAIRTLIGSFVSAIVGTLMALQGLGVWSLVGMTLTDQIVGTIMFWKSSDWRPGFRVSAKHLRDLLNYGVNVVGIVILVFLSRRIDDFLIGYYLGPVVLGYYSIAYRIWTIINQTMCDQPQKVAMPTFSKLQSEIGRFQSAFYKSSQLLSLVTFPLFFEVAVLSPEIVRNVFGRQWEPSIPVLQCLMIAGCLQSTFYLCGPALMAKGKPSWNLGLFFLNAAFSAIAFLLVVQGGIIAVSASLVAVALLMYPAYLWVLRRQLNIQLIPFISKYVPAFSASLLMVGAILLAKYLLGSSLQPPLDLAVYIIIGTSTYITAIALFAKDLYNQAFRLVRSFGLSS